MLNCTDLACVLHHHHFYAHLHHLKRHLDDHHHDHDDEDECKCRLYFFLTPKTQNLTEGLHKKLVESMP